MRARATPNIAIIQGDITQQRVNAIVNAANEALLPGGGVSGAIHRVAGPLLFYECRALGGCETGDAKITQGYELPARFVIHTVGPIWEGGEQGEDELLARCYWRSLALAQEHGFRSIAFPTISTGTYGFPVERAAQIALREIRTFFALGQGSAIEQVVIVCFDERTYHAYLSAADLRASG
jgi:O-acetyl-ADP-ribose deacetylase (regulator of RNase III)